MTTLKILSLETVSTMDDGRLREAFDQALARCLSDMRDRPGVGTARKIKLTVSLSPNVNDAGELDTVGVGFDFTEDIPKRSSRRRTPNPADR